MYSVFCENPGGLGCCCLDSFYQLKKPSYPEFAEGVCRLALFLSAAVNQAFLCYPVNVIYWLLRGGSTSPFSLLMGTGRLKIELGTWWLFWNWSALPGGQGHEGVKLHQAVILPAPTELALMFIFYPGYWWFSQPWCKIINFMDLCWMISFLFHWFFSCCLPSLYWGLHPQDEGRELFSHFYWFLLVMVAF